MSKKTGNKKPSPLIKGVLDITRSGMGYLIADGRDEDILIRPQDFNRAMHGDTVRVKLKEHKHKRAEGEVSEVVSRKQTEFIGSMEVSDSFAFFKPDSQKPLPDFYINKKNLNGAVNNDRVVVRLLKWDSDERKPEGEVINVLVAKSPGDMAMKELIIRNGFPLKFSDEVLNEVALLNEKVTPEELRTATETFLFSFFASRFACSASCNAPF